MKVIIHMYPDDVPKAAGVVAGAWRATDYTGEEIKVKLKGVDKAVKSEVWYLASRLYEATKEKVCAVSPAIAA
jgi:hypothetical protein